MKFLDKLLRRPYKGISISIHFHDSKAWNQFLNDYHPKLITLGKDPTSKNCFDTCNLTIKGVKITAYSPYYPNPKFSKELAEKLWKIERENPPFRITEPHIYATEYLRKVHRIVEEELRLRRQEEIKEES